MANRRAPASVEAKDTRDLAVATENGPAPASAEPKDIRDLGQSIHDQAIRQLQLGDRSADGDDVAGGVALVYGQ